MSNGLARVLLAVLTAVVLPQSAAAGLPRQARQDIWPGTITRTVAFSGVQGGRRVTFRREERWERFLIKKARADGSSASFRTTWIIDESRTEVTERCKTTMVARGSGPYPWFNFDVNPLDEVSYRLYSTGSGQGGPEVKGTMTHACRGEAATSAPYLAHASWLAAPPLEVPPGLLPPGIEAPVADASAFGATVSGKLDPAQPDVLRGRSAVRGRDGTTTVLTWSLSRSGECADDEARQLVAHESARLGEAEAASRSEEVGPPAPAGPAAVPDGAAPPAAAPTFNQPLSPESVGQALTQALGGADLLALGAASGTDEAGLRHFGVRLGLDRRPLPSLAALQHQIESACVAPGSVEAARTLLVGSVMWVGNRFRINLRTVETETAVVIDGASDSGAGGSAELQVALEAALRRFVVGH